MLPVKEVPGPIKYSPALYTHEGFQATLMHHGGIICSGCGIGFQAGQLKDRHGDFFSADFHGEAGQGERYALTSQVRRSVVSIPSNIAEIERILKR